MHMAAECDELDDNVIQEYVHLYAYKDCQQSRTLHVQQCAAYSLVH